MPIYEYICNPCNKRVNLFFRSYDEADRITAVCPDCENSDLRRLISASSISSGKNNSTPQQKISPQQQTQQQQQQQQKQ